jgi:glycosyltransferase involved in cell wall biosynthesis
LAKTTFVMLSFEGPDLYSHAGGVGSRVDELSRTLAVRGFETHLFFIGDPALPAYEVAQDGNLHLHRWCQWISGYHLGGVYDGEEGKLRDWQDSLPLWLTDELLGPKVANGESIVILAEEWQTAETVVRLHAIIERNGWLENVRLLWNANNTFSFDRIDWPAIERAATVTTVSRYMKREMWDRGIDPRVIPNGIEDAWLGPAPVSAVTAARCLFAGRLSVLKVGRFDPNKRWLAAIEAIALLKQHGHRPLLIARGGNEAHGWDVYSHASGLGLSIDRCAWSEDEGLYAALSRHLDADVVFLDGHLGFDDRKALYQASHAVLANSAIEPFGLVGLEAMASGGLVLVGSTGEDYSLSGHDSISLQTATPGEIVHHLLAHDTNRARAAKMRKAARTAAGRFTWSSVLDRALLPLLRELGVTLQASPAAGSKRMQEREKPKTAATEPAITAPDYLLAAAATRAVAPPIAPA